MAKTFDKTEEPLDVIVVGAGAVGLSIGWRVAQAGMSVCVLDAERAGAGASGVAAGMLAPISEADFGERHLLELNVAAAERYPSFIAELQALTGAQTGYRQLGTLAIATDRDELEILERMFELQRSLDLETRWLSSGDARELEPGLATGIRGGIHAPDDHQVSPRALLAALALALRHAGGELRAPCRVGTMLDGDGGVTGVELESGARLASRSVVIAAGCWSGEIGGVAQPIELRPVKGQILRLQGSAERPVATHVVRTPEVYVVPRADGRLVVGATVEERGFDRSVTAGAVLELLRRAYDLLPGITELELIETTAGLRPATPDNGPLVGAGAIDGLWWATGHWRNGVLQAPLTADAIVAGLRGDPLPDSLEPFSPRRFAAQEVAT